MTDTTPADDFADFMNRALEGKDNRVVMRDPAYAEPEPAPTAEAPSPDDPEPDPGQNVGTQPDPAAEFVAWLGQHLR